MVWDVLTNYSTLIIIGSVGTFLLYYCRKCCKQFLFCHSNNEIKFDDEQYDSNFSYSHHKINN